MNFNIPSWNIGGSKFEAKATALRRSTEKYKPLVVTIQENKCRKSNEKLISFLWGNKAREWLDLPYISASGGILLLWD